MIEDLSSMHGTWLNGQPLVAKEPQRVKDGDKLVFGAEVRRGAEVFSAHTYSTSIKYSSFR